MNSLRAAAAGVASTPGRLPWQAVETSYTLAVPSGERRRLASAWLLLSTAALAGAGIFSVLLVAVRTPQLMHWFPAVDFFRVALVVHVDLSMLVWFFALAGVLWTVNGGARLMPLGWTAFVVSALGASAMAAAPFVAQGQPIMSNYIPVIDSHPFLAGLAVFAAGAVLLTVRGLAAMRPMSFSIDGAGSLRFGLDTAAVSAAIAVFAFVWSYAALVPEVPRQAYFEALFWGGGHVLQFTYTLLMLVAWLALAAACRASISLSPRAVVFMFAIALAPVFAVPAIYAAYDVASSEHRQFMTWLMRFGSAPAVVPVGLAVIVALWRVSRVPDAARPMHAALIASLVLFGVGGLMGFAIDGADTRIPAHYHGCIVGVTLALMGLAYMLLPRLGWAPPSRLASAQPWLYGAGQLMHVAGLMWSGGHGVQRKVAGSEQVLRMGSETFAMGLMGAGGLVAVIGGLLFVVVIAQSAWRSRASAMRNHT